MGIFSNLKINSLRKKTENKYESRMEKLTANLDKFSDDQKKELATMALFVLEATSFAKAMNYSLFHPDYGVFRNDINNLNELNFDKLYEIMVVWFSWTQIPIDQEGKINPKGIDFCANSLEIFVGINQPITRLYCSGLTETSNLVGAVLYRWCMLAVGHNDINWDTLHEDSPDCELFLRTIISAREENKKH